MRGGVVAALHIVRVGSHLEGTPHQLYDSDAAAITGVLAGHHQ